jgi:hypothetical protein
MACIPRQQILAIKSKAVLRLLPAVRAGNPFEAGAFRMAQQGGIVHRPRTGRSLPGLAGHPEERNSASAAWQGGERRGGLVQDVESWHPIIAHLRVL